MKILNTPSLQFDNLSDYTFTPNFIDVGDGLQMHYVDEGARDGEVVLLLHGEPSWSYLYRKMIPLYVAAGYRVLAPDLIGFGKSSKPTEQSDYTYARHIEWVTNWMEELELNDINLFCQDWGGLIGLRLVAQFSEKFARVVVANTGLPTGDQEFPEAFKKWQLFSQTVDVLPIESIMQKSTVGELSEAELKAYNAPFPDPSYMAGAKIFPTLVPTTADNVESNNNRQAWKSLSQFNKPFLTLFSDQDPITKGGDKIFQKFVKGTQNQPHHIIENAGHFLQEDKGEEIAHRMIEFMQA